MRRRHRRALAPVLVGLALLFPIVAAMATQPTFIGPAYPAGQPNCFPLKHDGSPDDRGLTPRQWQSVVGLPIAPSGTPAAQRIVVGERDQTADIAGVRTLLSDCGLPTATINESGVVSPHGGEATLDAAVVAAGLPADSELYVTNVLTSDGFSGLLSATANSCGIDLSGPTPTKRSAAAGPDSPAWPAGGCIISVSHTDNENTIFPANSSDTQAADLILNQLQALGVIVVFSAGDESSGGCSTNPTANYNSIGLTPKYPATHPAVLAVGGTQWDSQTDSMVIGRDKRYVPGDTYRNVVWKDNSSSPKCANFTAGGATGGSGGGGGQSSHFTMPSYQTAAAAVNYPSNPGRRLVPDVTAMATWPMYAIIKDGNWELTGGTSAAAPSVAVGIANVNANLSSLGLPIIDNSSGSMGIHTLVYSSTDSSQFISDVTDGDDDLFGFNGSTVMPGYSPTAPAWLAQPGYDMASGMGVINFGLLNTMLVNRLTPVPTPTPAPPHPTPAPPTPTQTPTPTLSPTITPSPSPSILASPTPTPSATKSAEVRLIAPGVQLASSDPGVRVVRVSSLKLASTTLAKARSIDVRRSAWTQVRMQVLPSRNYTVAIKSGGQWRTFGDARSDADGFISFGPLQFTSTGTQSVRALLPDGRAFFLDLKVVKP